MKKLVSLIALIFMLSGILAGCDIMSKAPEDDRLDETPNETTDETPNETTDETPNETTDETPNETTDETPEDNPDLPDSDPLPPVGTAVGNRFGDLTLETLDGTPINTADLRGKIIIFNVWATWCPPCVEELPAFDRFAKEYADDVVVIAAHTYDTGMYDMPSFVAQNLDDPAIIFAYDDKNAAFIAAGGTRYVPQTAIIGRDGVILYTDSGALSYDWLVSFIEANK